MYWRKVLFVSVLLGILWGTLYALSWRWLGEADELEIPPDLEVPIHCVCTCDGETAELEVTPAVTE